MMKKKIEKGKKTKDKEVEMVRWKTQMRCPEINRLRALNSQYLALQSKHMVVKYSLHFIQFGSLLEYRVT